MPIVIIIVILIGIVLAVFLPNYLKQKNKFEEGKQRLLKKIQKTAEQELSDWLLNENKVKPVAVQTTGGFTYKNDTCTCIILKYKFNTNSQWMLGIVSDNGTFSKNTLFNIQTAPNDARNLLNIMGAHISTATTVLPNAKKCPKCDNPIGKDVKVCPNCHYRLDETSVDFDIEKLERVVSEVKKHTARESYSIELLQEKTTIFDSKFGGLPYWDLSKEYPVDKNGNKLILLAQINLEQENFGSDKLVNRGMLQFFVENEFDCVEQDVNKVIYHENIDIKVTEEDIKKLNIPTTFDSQIDITIKDEYKLIFKKVKEAISFNDYRFYEVLEKAYNKLYDTNDFDEMWDKWTEYDAIYDKFSDGAGHKLLGFPHFCQEDPRSAIISNASQNQSNVKLATSLNENGNKTMSWFPSASDMNKINEEKNKEKDISNYNTLLLQIDTCKEFVWGDNGQVNIFINSKDLKNLNFNKVLWNFDCY